MLNALAQQNTAKPSNCLGLNGGELGAANGGGNKHEETSQVGET